jgi:hypothetical protein
MRPDLARACACLCVLAAAVAPAAAAAPRAGPAEAACAADDDCGYQPDHDRCAADPRANRQPPLTDQGIVCYCDDAARRCSMMRVLPVPCESDASCAVRLDPRPHPVAADAAHPHERGRPCRDYTIATTCEHTNLCTMRRLPCPAARGGER